MLIYLFGGYARHGNMHGRPCLMRFLTLKGALNYPQSFWGSIDPYTRFLTGDVVPIPGKIFRR